MHPRRLPWRLAPLEAIGSGMPSCFQTRSGRPDGACQPFADIPEGEGLIQQILQWAGVVRAGVGSWPAVRPLEGAGAPVGAPGDSLLWCLRVFPAGISVSGSAGLLGPKHPEHG